MYFIYTNCMSIRYINRKKKEEMKRKEEVVEEDNSNSRCVGPIAYLLNKKFKLRFSLINFS